MRPDLRDAAYLWDIVDAGRTAIEAARHLDLAAYERDRVVQLAVERCIEIIGEAARRLSDGFKASRPEIPWTKIVGQRNVLAHEYREVQQERLWRVVLEELPGLVAAIEAELPPPPAGDE
jgi:uncharacterized protein with HEPN domain